MNIFNRVGWHCLKCRYPKMWYAPEGGEFSLRLWEETLQELKLFGVNEIVGSMKG